MWLFNTHVIPCHSTSDFHSKLKKKIMLQTILESVTIVFIVAIAVFVLIEYITLLSQAAHEPTFQPEWRSFSPAKLADVQRKRSSASCEHDPVDH